MRSIIYITLTIILTGNVGMLLVIGAIIASISVFITFGTSASASLSDFTINTSPENKTDESGTNTSEMEPSQELTPSESLTLRGLAPQGESDLSVACSVFPERC